MKLRIPPSKAARLVALAVLAFTLGTGCTLGDALLDGVFLGVSETIGVMITSIVVG